MNAYDAGGMELFPILNLTFEKATSKIKLSQYTQEGVTHNEKDIRFDVTVINGAEEEPQFNLMIATGDYCDIITTMGYYSTGSQCSGGTSPSPAKYRSI